MNAVTIKFFLILIIYSLGCASQTKNDDAYFILDSNHADYVIKGDGKVINDIKNPFNIRKFYLYNRSQYNEREKQIEIDKKQGKFIGYQYYNRPDELVFYVVNRHKESITNCDINSLRIVDYKWVEMNTWKENNPNILFKNLYFMIKIEKDKYLKFGVERTVIAR